jgi:hypothetical protein
MPVVAIRHSPMAPQFSALLWDAETKITRKRIPAMAGRIAALLNILTLPDVEALGPTERRSFAERCRHWAYLADRSRIESQGSGVLAELRAGYRFD